jgi:DNA primase
MAQIPSEEINRIQRDADIVKIIGEFIKLEKRGKNYMGVCPFHDDHSPSLSVSEEKNIFTCFTCHESGTVFDFVQKYLNLSFVEAVKKVAELSGTELNGTYTVSTRYDKLYDAMNIAVKYYQNNLQSKAGIKAKEYLIKRGINEDIINEFQIGYASPEFDTLTKLLLSKGFTESNLLDAGISNKSNSVYDLFRDRVTFPIHDPQGRPVGFSARIYENKDEAKYINTKETNIFKKGHILFNFHRAQNEARRVKYLLLVEGQMDAIRVYAEGVKNVCAIMGTAFTPDHAKLIKRLNVPVVLCLDNDAAGEHATIVNGEILAKEDIEVKVVRLTGEKDPDEYILKNGVDKFKDAIEHSINFFDFKLTVLKKNKNFNKVDDQSAYINSVIKELNKTNDQILIDLTINKLCEEFNVDKNILLNKIIKVEPVQVLEKPSIKKKKLNRFQKLQETLVYYMMNDEKYIKVYEQELSELPDEEYNNIALDIQAFYLKYNYISIADFLTNEIEEESYQKVLDIVDDNFNIELIDNDFIGFIENIKNQELENKIEALKLQISQESDINKKLELMDAIAKMKVKE